VEVAHTDKGEGADYSAVFNWIEVSAQSDFYDNTDASLSTQCLHRIRHARRP
jgi:hypothetical protein